MLLLAAQFTSQAADGIAQAAFADVLVLEPLGERTPARILAVFALTLLPYSLISPWLGVVVDRWRRRSLLVVSALLRAVLLFSLPLWSPLLPGDAGLYVAVLALLGLGRLWLTTKSAVLPGLLHERHLLGGNSISSGGGMISALGGGVAGIALAATLGSTSALVAAGAVYLLSSLVARLISSDPLPVHAGRSGLAVEIAKLRLELGAGLREVWRRRAVRLSLMGIFLLRAVVMFVAVIAILAINNEFPDATDRFGRLSAGAVALGAVGAGALLGALFTPALGRRLSRAALLLVGFVVAAIALLSLGAIGTLSSILALMFVGGFGAFVAKVAVDAEVQEGLQDVYRGRAFSLYDILYNIASVVAAGAVVALGASGDPRGPLLLAGVAALVMGAGLGVALNRAGMLQQLPSG